MWCKSRLTGGVNWFNVPDAIAGWSSLVARRAHNPKVGSSNLPPATNTFRGLDLLDPGPFFFGIFSKETILLYLLGIMQRKEDIFTNYLLVIQGSGG